MAARSLLRRRGVLMLALAACVVSTVALPGPANAGERHHDARSLAFGPDDQPYGQTYSALAVNWWKWVFTQPLAVNPIANDQDGRFCAQGQSGKVWFLGGTFGPPSVDRTCTVPKGTRLVFPVLNAFYAAFPQDKAEVKTEAFARGQANQFVVGATNLHATIDGVAVPDIARYYEQTRIFDLTLPADNIFGLNEHCESVTPPAPVTAGCHLDPMVDAGYYLALRPLRAGTHMLSFGGTFANGNSLEANYTITVTKGDRHHDHHGGRQHPDSSTARRSN